MKNIFITGGTGYIGTRLIIGLLKKGYTVTALVRKGSEQKVPAGARVLIADPFAADTFQSAITPGSIFIQLLGVAHPSPKKAELFRQIDLRSVKASADAASQAAVSQFIYVSVAMEASRLMHAYQEVRKQGEDYCLSKGLHCTFIRPWYVLGPGHWWPVLLLPFYGLAAIIPAWRRKAQAMGLVTILQMVNSLIYAVEADEQPLRILEIRDIRNNGAKKIPGTRTLAENPSYL